MERKESAAVILMAGILFFPNFLPAVEKQDTTYHKTVLRLDNSDHQNIVDRIREEIQRNDHTARLLWYAGHNRLFIIHHRSLSTTQLGLVLDDLSVPATIESHGGFKFSHKAPGQENPEGFTGGRRICGATKTTWKKLLRKYFH